MTTTARAFFNVLVLSAAAFQKQTSFGCRFLRPLKSRLPSAGVSCCLSSADFFRLAFFLPSSADFFRLPFLAAFQKQTAFGWRFFCLSKADFFRLPFLAASQAQTSFDWRFLLPVKSRLLSAAVSCCLSRADYLRSTHVSVLRFRRRRGRRGSYPPLPRPDPGVRFSRTGLFRHTRFRNATRAAVCYPPQISWPCLSRSAVWARFTSVGYVCLSVPSPLAVSCRVNGPTVSEYYGLIRLPVRLRLSYLVFRFGLPVSR